MPEICLLPEIGSRVLRMLLRFAAALLLLFGVAGCGAALDTQPAQMRVAHASLHAGTLDVLSRSTGSEFAGIAYNLSFGTVTTYFQVNAPAYTVTSSDTHTECAEARVNACKAKHCTMLVRDTATGVVAKVLTDQDQPAPAGLVSLRFINEMLEGTPVDLYLVPLDGAGSRTAMVAAGLGADTNSAYITIAPGTYTLQAMTAGVPLHAADPIFVGPAIRYASGSVRTLVLLNQSPASHSAIGIVTLTDFDPVPVFVR